VAGIDIRDLRLPNVNVPLQIYNGRSIPFADDYFDVSLVFYVLHHCEDPEQVLREAIRVTRGKIIIIEEFDRPHADETSLDLTERQSHRALGIPSDLYYQLFDQSEFEQVLQTHNLVQLDRQLLPSKTTRPVDKYLYVMGLGI
jgi:ubiquinone/menaquinone biosynthesis C-methylase UbiE